MTLDKLDIVYKAFADKNRLRILKLLENRKLCVCEIAYVLEIAEASVSRHLKKLKAAGVINSEQCGHWVYYFIEAKNPYASDLLEKLIVYINDDEVIKADALRSLKAKKEILCK